MPKLLPNRISKTLDPQVMADMRKSTDAIDDSIGDLTPIGDEEEGRLVDVGPIRKRVADAIYLIMGQHPTAILPHISLAETAKDKSYTEDLAELKSLLEGLLFKVKHELRIVSAEYQNETAVFEDDVNFMLKRDNPGLKVVKAKLDAIDRNSPGGGGGSKDKPDTPPAPPTA